MVHMKKEISVIGVPMWLGQTRYGTNLGPNAIRSAGLIDHLKNISPNVIDEGNIRIGITGQIQRNGENIKNLKTVAAANDKLATKVSLVMEKNRFPLILGGDHSIAIGSLAGAAQHCKTLGVIWYDAHADINTPETSPSGNIHGMPLAASIGLGHPALVNVAGYKGKIKPENIVFIGARDLDDGEKQLIAEKNIKIYSAEAVKNKGITLVIKEALEYLAKHCDGIHLSFDLDGIDPQNAPGVGTPVAGGISYADSLYALQLLFNSNKITSAEFVEVNPLLDKDNITAQLTVHLIGALFGETLHNKYALKEKQLENSKAI